MLGAHCPCPAEAGAAERWHPGYHAEALRGWQVPGSSTTSTLRFQDVRAFASRLQSFWFETCKLLLLDYRVLASRRQSLGLRASEARIEDFIASASRARFRVLKQRRL